MPKTGVTVGQWLREKRMRASLGLRQFAQMINDLPSNVCNIENGKRQVWQREPKLRQVAHVLGIEENTEDWDRLFDLARRPDRPPADLAGSIQGKVMPTLLRTINEYQLNDDELGQLLKYVRRTFGKGRGPKDG